MLKNLHKTGESYYAFLGDKEVLVKASSSDLQPETFPALVHAVTRMVSNGVRVVLCYSGQTQIHAGRAEAQSSHLWRVHAADMPQVAETAARLETQLRGAFPVHNVLERGHILCDTADGVRGVPRGIGIGNPKPLTLVGFLGEADGKEIYVEPNDVALQIAREHATRMHEVFVLSRTGGIPDKDGKILPLMDETGLDDVIRNTHSKTELPVRERRRLLLLRKMLPLSGKIAMTKADELLDEVENWSGGPSSTLLFHSRSLVNAPLDLDREGGIFDAMYDEYVRTGRFRARSDEELRKLKRNHFVLRAKGSPIGGYTLYPHADGWAEISALWSGYAGHGVGDRLLAAAKDQARVMGTADSDTNLYALSVDPDLVKLFTRCGFAHHGPVSAAKTLPLSLPESVRGYAAQGRDPHVFTYRELLEGGMDDA